MDRQLATSLLLRGLLLVMLRWLLAGLMRGRLLAMLRGLLRGLLSWLLNKLLRGMLRGLPKPLISARLCPTRSERRRSREHPTHVPR